MSTEAIMIVGPPAAGKSTLVRQFEAQGFTILNRDTLGGSISGLSMRLREAHARGDRRFVFDNTHGTKESRAGIVETLRNLGIPVRCLVMQTTPEQAQFNAARRLVQKYSKLLAAADMKGLKDPNAFPPVAQSAYFKHFEHPTCVEGFTTIEVVPFVRSLGPEYTNKALILDFDGTLRETISGAKYPTDPADVRVLPGRVDVLRRYQRMGYLLLGASNQSGVAKGALTVDQAEACFRQTSKLLGFDYTQGGLGPAIDVQFCPHASGPPQCWCQKPLPGMGVVHIERYKLDPSQCIYVGDMTKDATFAKRCGFRFYLASDFFGG